MKKIDHIWVKEKSFLAYWKSDFDWKCSRRNVWGERSRKNRAKKFSTFFVYYLKHSEFFIVSKSFLLLYKVSEKSKRKSEKISNFFYTLKSFSLSCAWFDFGAFSFFLLLAQPREQISNFYSDKFWLDSESFKGKIIKKSYEKKSERKFSFPVRSEEFSDCECNYVYVFFSSTQCDSLIFFTTFLLALL